MKGIFEMPFICYLLISKSILMKKLLFGLFLISLFGCKNNDDKPVKSSIKSSDYEQVYVGFLDKTINIPKGYETTTIAAHRDSLTNQFDMEFSEEMTEAWRRIELLTTDYMLFVDNDNPPNSIWMELGEYVDFDPTMAAHYIQLLKTQMEQNALIGGFGFELLEKNFGKTKDTKILKVKFLKNLELQTLYWTQYIITTEGQTFSIVVTSTTDEDFEAIFKMI